MYFDSNIKLLRRRKKLTQDAVAEQLQMKRSTLSGYENSVAQPGVEVLLQFSNYYQIAVDTLLRVDLSKMSETQLRQLDTTLKKFQRVVKRNLAVLKLRNYLLKLFDSAFKFFFCHCFLVPYRAYYYSRTLSTKQSTLPLYMSRRSRSPAFTSAA